MNVLLTGSSGFIGSYILRELVRCGHTVKCLVRNPDKRMVAESVDVTKVQGDILDANSLRRAVEGCDAVIHLVGIIDEDKKKGITFEQIHHQGTINISAAAKDSGVQRFVQMSANGASPTGVSSYLTSKWEAEKAVEEAGFAHSVIIRPSLVFGKPEDGQPEFCTRLAETLISKFPILPVFGDALYRMQPIHVTEIASAFLQAMVSDKHAGQTYVAVGKQSFTYLEILDLITQGMGMRPKKKIHQPVWLVRPMISRLSGTGALPISIDQFEMLLQGNIGNDEPFYTSFDLENRPFDTTNLAYLRK